MADNDTASSPLPSSDEILACDVHAALKALSFAASRGIELDADVVDKITPLFGAEPKAPPAADRVAFYVAYRKLMREVRPATIASIDYVTSKSQKEAWFFKKHTRAYIWAMMVLLLLTLVLHFTHVNKSNRVLALEEIRADYPTRFTTFLSHVQRVKQDIEFLSIGKDQNQSFISVDYARTSDRARSQQIETELAAAGGSVAEVCGSLDRWEAVLTGVSFTADAESLSNVVAKPLRRLLLAVGVREDSANAAAPAPAANCTVSLADYVENYGNRFQHAKLGSVEQIARIEDMKILLNTLSQFVLPALYGLIGALAAIIRTIVGGVRSGSYEPGVAGLFRLQWPLGMLAGATVGLVFRPESLSAFSSLTSFGVAFVAGYAVDKVFGLLDRIGAGASPTEKAR